MKKLLFAVLAALLLCAAGGAAADPACIPYPVRCSVYYQTLDSGKKQVFDALYDALWRCDSQVDVPPVCTREEARAMLNQIFNECPELCAFEPTRCLCEANTSGAGARIYRFHLRYKRTEAEQRDFIARVRGIAGGFRSFGDVLNYVCATMEYDYVSEDAGKRFAYECMQRGKGVCNGYAQVVVMLCHFAGIECSYINGTAADGGHAWNIVGVGGRYTLVDVTWADVDSSVRNDAWIGLSTAEMNATHTPYPDRYPIPACVNMQASLIGPSAGTPPANVPTVSAPSAGTQAVTADVMNYDAIGFMLRSGDRGDRVRSLQKRLIQLGYLNDKADGVYGKKTRAAVAAFQENNGIHGVSGGPGVATELTQAALYSDRALPRGAARRIPAWSWSGDRVPFSIWVGGIGITGSAGTLNFTFRNDCPARPIVGLTVRYWADGAKGAGDLVCPMYDYTLWGLNIAPGESRAISIPMGPEAGLRKAAMVKWNVIEVQFSDGEVFISENLSGETGYYIRTYNQNVTPR